MGNTPSGLTPQQAEQLRRENERLKRQLNKKPPKSNSDPFEPFRQNLESFEQHHDAFAILDIDPSQLDEQTLKQKYRKLVLQHHPDKGGNQEIFKMITQSFLVLQERIKMGNTDRRTHLDLKEDFKRQEPVKLKKTVRPEEVSGKNFNRERFNNLFDENRMENPFDKGYGNMEDYKEEQTYTGGYNADSFNSAFENVKKQHHETFKDIKKNGKVVVYKEPEALVGGRLNFTELGVDEIDDFSSDPVAPSSIHFTDYKAAYGEKSKLEYVEDDRPTYKNIEDIKNARSKISYVMDDGQRELLEKQKYEDELAEQRRMETLMKQDDAYRQHFEKMNQLMLGH